MANSLGLGVTRVRDGTWKPLRGLYLYRNSNFLTVEYLVVGGGGGGTGGGGGGGGGAKTGSTSFAKNTKVPVVVGNGGSGTSLAANWAKSNGENSSIGDVVAYGGGGGGFSNDIAPTALIDPSLPGATTGNYDIIVNDYTYFPPLTAPIPVAGTKVVAFGLTKGVAWEFGGSDQVSTGGTDTSGFKFVNDGTSSFTAEAFFYATNTTTLGSLFSTATNSNQIGFWFGMNSAVPPTTPAQVDLTITLKGGGGGGGGNDSHVGADGQPGSIVTVARTAFSTGESISIFPGEGGGAGSGGGGAPGGAGGRSGGGYGGGAGSASGPGGSSGAGGGGGAASVVVYSNGDTAVALGGGGGGGGGNVGNANGRGPSGGVSGSHQGGGGTGKGGDGGGAGGGGGGWAGGAGGAVQDGDQGGYSGTSGTNYVSGVGAVAGTSAANGGGHGGGAGGNGSVVISYQSALGALFSGGTIAIDGTTVTHTFTPSQSFNTTLSPSAAAVQTPTTGKPGSFSFWQLTGGNTYRVFSTANSVYTANRWNHVAFVYNQVANTPYLYLNGVSLPLTTNTVYYAPTYVPRNASPSTTLKIGAGFAGSLSNLRITKAIVYGTNFTPSTDPLTVLTDTVLLTAGQPSLVDESGHFTIIKPATATYSFKSVPVGNLNYDTYSSGAWTYNRILNIIKPFVLTTYDKLQFQINRSSDSSTRWGEIPDQGDDYFLLEYSVDGSTNWITLDTTNVNDVAGDTWVEKFVTLPPGAKISAGVYLRYRNHGAMGGNRISPRDNWAVTTLYSGIGGAGRSGGSGGGGAAGITSKPPNPAQVGGIATAGGAQGFDGGSGSYEGYNYAGGGGGGAGGIGFSYNSGAVASNGGIGVASVLLGPRTLNPSGRRFYGGGGGGIRRGGYWSETTGLGGDGGGGNGYGESNTILRRTAGDGLSNTGGGGGALGGNGGSGVVIIRYPASEPLAKGGDISTYTLGGIQYQVHLFKTSDTLELLPIKAGVIGEGTWTAVKTMWKKYSGAWVRVYPTPSAAPTISPTSATVQCYNANTSSAVTYTMINDGDEDINVLSAAISSNPNFTVNMDYTGFGGSVVTTIIAKTRKTFALTVTGTSNGTSTANIVFTLNIGAYGTSTASFSITGTIIPLYATASINTTALTLLGDKNAAVPNPLATVTIRNTGNGPLNITGISASKGIATIGSAPTSVTAGGSQAFTVKLPDTLRNTQWFHYLDNSVYFDGSSVLEYYGSARTGNSLFTMAGDYTVECWIYQIDRPKGYNAIFEIGSYPESDLLVRSGSGGKDDFYVGGQGHNLGSISQAISLNAWNHIATTRSGSNVTVFVNGIPIINSTYTGTINPSGYTITVGGDTHARDSQQFHGYISNFRFINGTCVYPPGVKFDLPLSAPEIVGGADTRLLTCQTSFNDPRAPAALQYTAKVVGTPLMCTLGPSTTTGSNRVLDDTIFIDSNSTGGRLTLTATFPSVDGGSNSSGLVADWQMDNIRDQWKVISQPAGVVNASYPSDWGTFINTYGIWWGDLYTVGTQTLTVSVWFPTAGVYSFYSSVDNSASITLDGNTLFSDVTNYTSFGSVSGQVGAGYHTFVLTCFNAGGRSSGNPGGIAFRINNPDGSELWNTRYITAYGAQRTALRDYKTNSRLGIITGATAGTIPDTTIPGYKFGANAGSYIQIIPNQPDLYVTDVKAESSTFECWCYATGIGQYDTYGGEFFNHDSDFEACRMSDGRIGVAWDWGVGTDTKLPGGGWIISPMPLVPLNTATHVAIVVDAYTLIIYINGKYAWSTEMDRQATNNTGTSTWIGNRQGGSQGFNGWIGAMRVWNYARTAQQISQNYNKTYTYPNV